MYANWKAFMPIKIIKIIPDFSWKCKDKETITICINIFVTWRDVAYSQVWWPILWICALQLTHSKCAHTQQWTHTHTVNTHPEQWAAIYAAAPGEQLWVRCLAQGHLSRGIEGGESAVHSLQFPHLQFLPARDSNSQPLDYESDSLTIRPRLPQYIMLMSSSASI